MTRICTVIIVMFLFLIVLPAAGQGNNVPVFDPPEQPMRFEATQIFDPIHIDGKLNEGVWAAAKSYTDFVQKDPYQQQPASGKTEVRILYDNKHLYIGAICHDNLVNRSNVRVQNMRRDFDYENNDLFGIALDGFRDKRNATIFQTSPYGSQRDMQVFDDEVFNLEWDALWKVRTHLSDSGWVAEFAIPWKTIRYHPNAEEIGILFTRNIRRLNEYDVLPAVPRSFYYRMSYEGVIVDIKPPPPVPNVQINPYVLYDQRSVKEGDNERVSDDTQKVGGEVKWAINTNSVLDVTVNTDFAQADADRQVVNLSRFSVLFPERRQFFLEGANIFNASVGEMIQPFFSRRIGLDDNGRGIPLDAGIRFTNQSANQSIGALVMRQRETDESPLTHFAIGRYSKNLGLQNKLGGLVTYRGEVSDSGANENYTATVDGLVRINQSLNIKAMVSSSKDDVTGDGIASQVWIGYQSNLFYFGLLESLVKNYNPGVGIELFGRDYLNTSPVIDFDFRPGWLPKNIRSLGPDLGADLFHDPTSGELIQADAFVSLVDIDFQTGANFEIRHEYSWQNLDEPFTPLDIVIDPGRYQFGSTTVSFTSDQSRKYATGLSYSFGKYYDGTLASYNASFRIAPLPHIEFSADYELNQLRSLGDQQQNKDTHLIGLNTRLALNPRVQLIGFYQWNTAQEREAWNVRLSWEYRPLSYVYIVFNRNHTDAMEVTERFESNQLIGKVTFLKQF